MYTYKIHIFFIDAEDIIYIKFFNKTTLKYLLYF